MQYKFYVLTTAGLVSGDIESDQDFINAPFGYVPYRVVSSCECTSELLDSFWQAVDQVLTINGLTQQDYIRAVRAYRDGVLIGENE